MTVVIIPSLITSGVDGFFDSYRRLSAQHRHKNTIRLAKERRLKEIINTVIEGKNNPVPDQQQNNHFVGKVHLQRQRVDPLSSRSMTASNKKRENLVRMNILKRFSDELTVILAIF